ncbi:MAG: hypothetical protein EXR82_09545 [Gammaproteobacteria bacterium]|nr:hypothetical protein [Gammaproteobacteria bacterium]
MIELRSIALWACLLAGCSLTPDRAASSKAPIPPPSATGPSACFFPREVQSFRVLDRSNLIVYAPDDRSAYHVRIASPSTSLRFVERVAFDPPNARICGYAGERLVIGRGTGTQRVPVIDVSRLAPGSLAALQAGSEGEALPTARPQPGPGPAIEGTTSPEATEKPGG